MSREPRVSGSAIPGQRRVRLHRSPPSRPPCHGLVASFCCSSVVLQMPLLARIATRPGAAGLAVVAAGGEGVAGQPRHQRRDGSRQSVAGAVEGAVSGRAEDSYRWAEDVVCGGVGSGACRRRRRQRQRRQQPAEAERVELAAAAAASWKARRRAWRRRRPWRRWRRCRQRCCSVRLTASGGRRRHP